jgi:hypothetical protein
MSRVVFFYYYIAVSQIQKYARRVKTKQLCGGLGRHFMGLRRAIRFELTPRRLRAIRNQAACRTHQKQQGENLETPTLSNKNNSFALSNGVTICLVPKISQQNQFTGGTLKNTKP